MLLAIPIFLPTHLIMGRDGSIVSVLNKLDHMEFNLMHIICFASYILFLQGLR
jgi:hypothetical protein